MRSMLGLRVCNMMLQTQKSLVRLSKNSWTGNRRMQNKMPNDSGWFQMLFNAKTLMSLSMLLIFWLRPWTLPSTDCWSEHHHWSPSGFGILPHVKELLLSWKLNAQSFSWHMKTELSGQTSWQIFVSKCKPVSLQLIVPHAEMPQCSRLALSCSFLLWQTPGDDSASPENAFRASCFLSQLVTT